MSVSGIAILDVLDRHGASEITAIASRLGEQVSYSDVASALASLADEGLVIPAPNSNRWQLTSAGRSRLCSP
jgi:DNA-binding IclR family transcriptional regulator